MHLRNKIPTQFSSGQFSPRLKVQSGCYDCSRRDTNLETAKGKQSRINHLVNITKSIWNTPSSSNKGPLSRFGCQLSDEKQPSILNICAVPLQPNLFLYQHNLNIMTRFERQVSVGGMILYFNQQSITEFHVGLVIKQDPRNFSVTTTGAIRSIDS